MSISTIFKLMLPILAMSLLQSCQEKPITYSTVTEGFDWGPAISKVILDLGKEIDPESINKDQIRVYSVRTYREMDFTSFKLADRATEHRIPREILKAYIPENSGHLLTLEMRVGPDLIEGSPFNYNLMSGFNEYVDTYYEITLEGITDQEIGRDGYTGNRNLIAEDFEHSIPFRHENINLLYASYMPEKAATGATPLIIWLHGAGEGGRNTRITVLGNKVVNLASESIQSFFGPTGVAILAPQSPTMWMDADGSKRYNIEIEGNRGTSYYTEALMALINAYIEKHPEIDKKRIYLGGCSNGGYMTMNMLMSYPGYFTAAFPVATPYKSSWIQADKIAAIKDTPIWFTHAATDAVVTIYEGRHGNDFMTYIPSRDEAGNLIPIEEHSNALYHALLEAGATNIHYSLFDKVEDTSGRYFKTDGVTPYEYMGHWSWIYTLNNECAEEIDGREVSLFEWLAAQ